MSNDSVGNSSNDNISNSGSDNNAENFLHTFGKVAGINLGIMLLYTILSLMLNSGSSSYDGEMGTALAMALFIFLHFVVLIIVSIALIIAGKTALAKAGFISLAVVLLVGFGTCLGVVTAI